MKLRTTIIIFFMFTNCAAALDWSEIMFNPLGNDNGKEYILLDGTESLEGCTINDSASNDKLVLLHNGTNRIVIVENESEWLNATINDTVYVVGAAIGNGLANTKETLTITCNTTVLSTSYDTAQLSGYQEGMSILYNNGWELGPVNGTLGAVINESVNVNNTNTSQNSTETPEFIDLAVDNYEIICNDTLLITVSATKGFVGENVSFTIIASAFATYELRTEKTLVASGDNLHRGSFMFALPDADKVKITAFSTACGREQRASRIITILPVPVQEVIESVEENVSVAVAASAPPDDPAPQQNRIEPTGAVVGQVVFDKNRSMVPWICGFGIVTLLVSVKVFFAIKKEDST